MTRIIPLGTNGYYPSFGRQTMSFLVLRDRQALLLDAGTGVARLAEPEIAAMTKDYDSLDVILSHYHLDHVIGLSYRPSVWRRGSFRIFGPAPPLADSDPDTALRRLLSPPLIPARIEEFRVPTELVPVQETEFQIGEIDVKVWRQAHPGGSIGIRLGDEIAYVTDTAATPENARHVRGVGLLIHELWFTDAEAEEEEKPGHSSVSEVADFVKDAEVGEVMLVHHRPSRTTSEIVRMAEEVGERSGCGAEAGMDGRTREVR